MIWALHLRWPGEVWEILSQTECPATLSPTSTPFLSLSTLQHLGQRAAVGQPRKSSNCQCGYWNPDHVEAPEFLNHPITVLGEHGLYPWAAVWYSKTWGYDSFTWVTAVQVNWSVTPSVWGVTLVSQCWSEALTGRGVCQTLWNSPLISW